MVRFGLADDPVEPASPAGRHNMAYDGSPSIRSVAFSPPRQRPRVQPHPPAPQHQQHPLLGADPPDAAAGAPDAEWMRNHMRTQRLIISRLKVRSCLAHCAVI